jgi:hypothetical protein
VLFQEGLFGCCFLLGEAVPLLRATSNQAPPNFSSLLLTFWKGQPKGIKQETLAVKKELHAVVHHQYYLLLTNLVVSEHAEK